MLYFQCQHTQNYYFYLIFFKKKGSESKVINPNIVHIMKHYNTAMKRFHGKDITHKGCLLKTKYRPGLKVF